MDPSTVVTINRGTSFYREERKAFAAYTSPYSGAFDLLDTLRVPRACNYRAANMSQLDYFYGQR